ARHQLDQQFLEDRLVQYVRQANQRLGVRHALAVDSAEGAVHQASAHLALAFIKAPVVQMLEDQHPKHDLGGGPQSTAALTLGMAPGQCRRDTIDESVVVEKGVDTSERGIPELVALTPDH